MGICATSYITKGVFVENAAKLLTSGFTGQLQNWWENILIEQERINILHHQLQDLIETIQDPQTSEVKPVIICISNIVEYLFIP